jgi:hypothetical protein
MDMTGGQSSGWTFVIGNTLVLIGAKRGPFSVIVTSVGKYLIAESTPSAFCLGVDAGRVLSVRRRTLLFADPPPDCAPQLRHTRKIAGQDNFMI